jgi:hypothetical protein
VASVALAWLLGALGMAQLYAVEFLVGGLSTVSYVAAQSCLPSVTSTWSIDFTPNPSIPPTSRDAILFSLLLLSGVVVGS